jgi:hypothetical protein
MFDQHCGSIRIDQALLRDDKLNRASLRRSNQLLRSDTAAHEAHASSEAVKRFEAAYRPELDGGDTVFTD